MEDVSSLTKEEFLKFLNCSHHSTKPQRIVLTGPRNTKITVLKQLGKFSAAGVKLEEFSLNRQVLRLPLPKVDLQSLSPRQVALRFRNQKTEKKRKKNNVIVSRFGRKLKKKQLNIQSLTGGRVNTRSSASYPTRSASKNKNKLSLKIIPKDTKPDNKKIDKKKMASWTVSSKPLQKPEQAKLFKPQFIIKYVPSEPTYFLKVAPANDPEDGKLKYSFDTLVKDIKNMKLPSPTWKIKVVVKSNKIASIIFTNKCVLERTVSFNAKSEVFEVVIENKPAILLGSPNAVACVEDIEILLNIIHTINAKNPMIHYKN